MEYTIKKCGKHRLIDIKKKILDVQTIQSLYKMFKKTNFAINCANVENFKDVKTIELLNSLNIPLIINTPQLIVQASILGHKNFPKIFISDYDFIDNKRMLTRRRFKVV